MQFAKNWFQSLYSGLISGGTWGVLDQLVTNSYGAQIILCCLLLTRHEHISSQNACTILWHKHRKPLSYSDSWTWNSVHCTDMCASGGVTWNKYIILRYEHRPMVLERQKTLLHAYLVPTSGLAMTLCCPGHQQASCACRCHKVTIRLYNCVQGLGTSICSDSELNLTPNY